MPTSREAETPDAGEDRRMKVEDDLELGGDLMKISQRHNIIEDIEADIRSRGSDTLHLNSAEFESVAGTDRRTPAVRSDARQASWGRRSGSWEIAPEVIGMNAGVTESKSYAAPKEAYQ